MWHITGIVPVGKSKYRIFLDGKAAFVLYKRECNAFKVEESGVLTYEQYSEIMTLLKKRALKYAVYILEAGDRTEGQIREKLWSAGYPEEVADYVVEKLCGYRYIDDKNYAENFLGRNCSVMSLYEIEAKLRGKKVPDEVVKEVISTYKSEHHDADDEAFLYLFNKKKIDPASLDIREKQKMAAYFRRKGFSYDLIRKYLSVDDFDSY